MVRRSDAQNQELMPLEQFKAAFRRVLKVTKKESDEQMARFQAENKAKRKPKT